MTIQSIAGSGGAASQTMTDAYVARLTVGERRIRSYVVQNRLIEIALSLGGPLVALASLVSVLLIER